MSSPDRGDVIRDLGNGWLTEVAELRAVKVPDAAAPPSAVYEALLTVRGHLDRVEAILSQAMTVRSGTELSARELDEKAGDEFDKRIKVRSARARDFESARERLAEASLDALRERQAARSAQKVADMAASVEARIRLAYRGLEGLRSDLQTALRHVSWEANNDR